MKVVNNLKRIILLVFTLIQFSYSAYAQQKKGYACGIALNEKGKPLANVRIRFFGTTSSGQRSSLNCRTNSDGTYSLKLPHGQFSIRDAIYDAKFEGETYHLPLYLVGENNDDMDSEKGLFHKIILKTSGLIAENNDRKDYIHYFGGAVSLDNFSIIDEMEKRGTKDAKLIIRFMPASKLIDGAEAKEIVIEKNLLVPYTNRIIMDIPLAKYSVTANVKLTNNTLIPLKLLATSTGKFITDQTIPDTQTTLIFKPKSGDPPLLTSNGTEKIDLRLSF